MHLEIAKDLAFVVVGGLLLAAFLPGVVLVVPTTSTPGPVDSVHGEIATQTYGLLWYDDAFDPVNGLLYVLPGPTYGTPVLLAVDPVRGSVTATVDLSGVADSMAIDTSSGNVFVATEAWHNASAFVEVIGGTSNALIGSVSLPQAYEPNAMAFDPENGDVYVVGNGPANNITVIAASTDTVVARLAGSGHGVLPVPSAHRVFVANGTSTIVLNATTNTLAGSLGSPGAPYDYQAESMALDALSGVVYTDGSWDGDTLSAFNGTTLQPLPWIHPGTYIGASGAYRLIFEPNTGELLLSCEVCMNRTSSDQVSSGLLRIDPRSGSVLGFDPVGASPSSLALDPTNGTLWGTDVEYNGVFLLSLLPASVITHPGSVVVYTGSSSGPSWYGFVVGSLFLAAGLFFLGVDGRRVRRHRRAKRTPDESEVKHLNPKLTPKE